MEALICAQRGHDRLQLICKSLDSTNLTPLAQVHSRVAPMEIINVIAILLSPVIAVTVTLWHQSRKEKRATKLWLFNTLIGTRQAPISEEAVRALNMIDVVFHDTSSARRLWREYFEMLCNEGLANPAGWATRSKKNLEMITEMAKVLGYGKEITHLDVDRVYHPVGLGAVTKKQNELQEELPRVL